jgi:hypothetical protein
MPLKTNVGVSRKIADQNYGSRGASVNLEVELDSSLIHEPERFHDRIRQVFRLAQQAIDEELNRQHGTASQQTSGTTNGLATQAPHNGGNGNASNGNVPNGNDQHTNGNGRTATTASEKQLNYARQLAKQIAGLGIRRLENLAAKMFGKQLVALSTLDASGLIDTLKSIKAGEIDINTVLNEATS